MYSNYIKVTLRDIKIKTDLLCFYSNYIKLVLNPLILYTTTSLSTSLLTKYKKRSWVPLDNVNITKQLKLFLHQINKW